MCQHHLYQKYSMERHIIVAWIKFLLVSVHFVTPAKEEFVGEINMYQSESL